MEIYLRKLRIEDSLISYKWRNNPEIWKFTGNRPDRVITLELEKEWIMKVLKNEDEARYAICLKPTNEYIGNIQLTNIKNKTAEFHIFIGELKYWGKGLGTKATKEMVRIGFEELLLNEIYLYVDNRNIAAIKAYLNCGFIIDSCINGKIRMFIRKYE